MSYDRLEEAKKQVDEVRGVMKKNVELVIDRGDHIDVLATKAEDLELGAARFKDQSTDLKRKECCRHVRNVAYIVFLLVIFALIIGVIYLSAKN